jgi:uridine kinase
MNKTFELLRSPLFLIGLIIRLALILYVLPEPVFKWFEPFLAVSVSTTTLDPWQEWLNQGGVLEAFPYGYAMWMFFLPLVLIGNLFSLPIEYSYGLTLVIADFGLLVLLSRILQCKDKILLGIYWLSPISLIATYCLGYNDLIPVFMLYASIYCIKDKRLWFSGLLLAAAISAKLSMALSLPFFLIYLIHNRALRQLLWKFIAGLSVGTCVFLLPFLWSKAGVIMLVGNPEVIKIYQLSLNLVGNTAIYLVPFTYMLMLYSSWRIKRINFDLFYALLGLAFMLVVLLTPATLGWYIWLLPLLVAYQIFGDKTAFYITSFFSVLYVTNAIFIIGENSTNEIINSFQISNLQFLGGSFLSIIHTSLLAIGAILGIRIWRETVSKNDFFRLSRKPFVIGVAGDSGSGKDTFVEAIISLFGRHSVATISGDDYHLWDRNEPMWQVITHINPIANDLETFAKNLIALTDGKSIKGRHYNHDSGKMSRPFKVSTNDIIIASGLHALTLPILRECYDLSIYLDIDENLRRFFKINRDIKNRGYTISQALDTIIKRMPDSEKFVKPQASYADLIFSLRPIQTTNLEFSLNQKCPRLKLVVKSRHGFNESSLKRVLIGVCGLHVDINNNYDTSEVEFTIEGETTEQDIRMSAQLICPKIFEFLDLEPQWQSGAIGLMQLITLLHINQSLTRRFL